jgi:hypothetical protein
LVRLDPGDVRVEIIPGVCDPRKPASWLFELMYVAFAVPIAPGPPGMIWVNSPKFQ